MRLLEYEGKELFKHYGLTVQQGILARTPEEAVAASEEIGYPVVLKAQVLAGGRGKAGGVKFAHTAEEAFETSRNILGMTIKNEITECLLVTEMCDIAQELYAGITIDPSVGLPILIFSSKGGVDIEQVAKESPEKLLKLHLVPTELLRQYNIIDFLRKSDLAVELLPKVAKEILQLISVFYGADATTAEINPLVVTKDREILALDAKAVIDDAALKRQSRFKSKMEKCSLLEERARKIGVNYVPLAGNIAVIAGGAGLAMATMDLVSHFQGKPASFLDTGGGISSERMAEALRISLATPGVEGVIINVFGGINNCQIMAKGIAEVIDEDQPSAQIVVKMRGHSQDEGWKILEERNVSIIKFGTSEEAVQSLLTRVGGKE
ncbi:MAG: ADP-forming succinate--CoA ligase subunit beta [Desulfitobacteriaceae bacterium]